MQLLGAICDLAAATTPEQQFAGFMLPHALPVDAFDAMLGHW